MFQPKGPSSGFIQKYEGMFYRCSAHSEIYVVHSPTNELFIKLRKV